MWVRIVAMLAGDLAGIASGLGVVFARRSWSARRIRARMRVHACCPLCGLQVDCTTGPEPIVEHLAVVHGRRVAGVVVRELPEPEPERQWTEDQL